MNDLDEIAAAARQTQVASYSGIVRAGSYAIATALVQSVEALTRTKSLPGWLLGLSLFPLMSLAAIVMLRPPNLDHQAAAILGTLALAALGWAVLPGGKRYGWRINRFHERSICVWFDTPHQAAKYREYLIRTIPRVPFVHTQVTYYWWVWFRM